MKRDVRLSASEWDAQAERYRQGICCHLIAKETGACRHTVMRQLRIREVVIKSRKDWVMESQSYRAEALRAGVKTCRECHLAVNLAQFVKDSGKVDGTTNVCKKCWNEHMRRIRTTAGWKKRRLGYIRKYRASEKGHRQMLESARRAMSRPGNRFTAGRQSAKKRGLSWGLHREEYLEAIKLQCKYCTGDLPPNGIGLDRIDNSIGYERSNVVPCCALCNLTRGDRFSYQEMIEIIGPCIRQIRALRNVGNVHIRPDYTPPIASGSHQ